MRKLTAVQSLYERRVSNAQSKRRLRALLARRAWLVPDADDAEALELASLESQIRTIKRERWPANR